MKTLSFFVVLACVDFAKPSKILGLLTCPSHSHHMYSKLLLETLAKRGHDITYIGVDEYENPPKNIRYLQVENAYDLYATLNYTVVSAQNPYSSVAMLDEWQELLGELIVKQDVFKQLLEIVKNEKFDLVIYDISTTSFLLGVVDILGRPPVLGVTPYSIPAWSFDLGGAPYPIQYNSHLTLKYGKYMTFFERLHNAALFLFDALHRRIHLRNMDALSKRVFGPQVRKISEILDDININIVNVNWVTDNPFPRTPGIVPIAGVHIAQTKPLPKDLKDFLDSAKEGVVYFSLGTNIHSVFLQDNELAALTEAFRRLAPIKILWKYEKEVLPGKPDNVKIAKWLPQNDILAHPNVRLFLTHGGMLSTQEAYHHGMPIVGLPIFLDQHVNVGKACAKGMGESLKLEGLQADDVELTIRKVISDRRYKESALALSKIFRDQERPPLDQLIYWTEYVIRHTGANHLRPATKNLNWFQSGLYDLILTLLTGVAMAIYVLYKISQMFFRICRSTKTKRE